MIPTLDQQSYQVFLKEYIKRSSLYQNILTTNRKKLSVFHFYKKLNFTTPQTNPFLIFASALNKTHSDHGDAPVLHLRDEFMRYVRFLLNTSADLYS